MGGVYESLSRNLQTPALHIDVLNGMHAFAILKSKRLVEHSEDGIFERSVGPSPIDPLKGSY